MTIDIQKRIRQRNFCQRVGERLYNLGNLDNQPKEVKHHYMMIGLRRASDWLKGDGGLTEELADTVAFSAHTEAENSWAEIKKEIDNPVILTQEGESSYLDEKAEEEDYIDFLKRKGWWHES
jgi:hypothetical protein